jgi:dTDP-4-dehydrorhamnose 3,5-epimerase
VPGSFLLVGDRVTDARGSFVEAYRHDEVTAHTGIEFELAQVNVSVSRKDVLRGIHATRPPGQVKIVTCHRGAMLDVVVDIRRGSPTYGRHARVVLEPGSGRSVLIGPGLGHGFLALADDTCVGYLCSTQYEPGTQLDIDPFDPDLAVDWGAREGLLLSEKDRNAPRLAQLAETGVLPHYGELPYVP